MNIPLIVTALVCLLILLICMDGYVKKHGAWLLICRFIGGRHMDGIRRTDASAFRRGTKIIHSHNGRASKWAHLKDIERMAIRFICMITLAVFGYGYFTNREYTFIGAIVCVLFLSMVNAGRIHRKIVGRYHSRGVTGPMTDALAPMLNIAPMVVGQSLTVRSDYATTKSLDKIGTLVLPDFFPANPTQRLGIEHLIRTRLGIETTFRWKVDEHPKWLEFVRSPIPPKEVKFSDMLPTMRALPMGHVLLGITGKGEKKIWDLTSEDSHCAVQALSRRGKTRLLLLMVCQLLHQGAEYVVCLDPKQVGIDEALANVPNVKVFSNPREIEVFWNAIKDFKLFMDERIEAFANDRTLTFRRALLVIDEVTMFQMMSKIHWDTIREKGSKAVPPCWLDVAAVLFQGAQFNCHILVFGQRLEASTLGGLLEQFGTKLLAGWNKRGWDRIVGINPMPVSSRIRGRFIHFDGEEPVSIQCVLGNDIELREYALAGQKMHNVKPSLEEMLERMEK